ncbi:hypothetical protein HNY73_002434 [Argiope bruennichi]|uniref:Uncharacterized protein n=1 Tax=Argiope bruennichi TaxID=94029 RepID=A0A8T0FTI1_ARGBR|nr:hypothetical protein HNY73_002434 [Argiope bruennichi]
MSQRMRTNLFNCKVIGVLSLKQWRSQNDPSISPLSSKQLSVFQQLKIKARAETKYPAAAQFSNSILLKPVEIRGSSSGIFRSPRVTHGRDLNAPRALLRRLPIRS